MSTELPRMFVVLLALIWVVCFMSFTVVSVLAFGSGNTFEYKLFGVQFPYAAVALLVGMATSSGLLWSTYRDEDFRSAEQLIYGALFGISVFGLILGVPLAILA